MRFAAAEAVEELATFLVQTACEYYLFVLHHQNAVFFL